MKFTIKPTLFILAALLSTAGAHSLVNPYASEFETKSVQKDIDTVKARKKLSQRFALLKTPSVETKAELAALNSEYAELTNRIKAIRSKISKKTTFEAAPFDTATKDLKKAFDAIRTEIKKNS
jgi:predicted  nucleic acid-binding Zn-ribbon protein